MGELTEVASGLLFPEGPVALDDGTVLVVEIARGTLSRVDPATGKVEVVAECGGGPNGAAVGPDGAVYVTNNGGCFDFIDLGGLMVPGPPPATYAGHGSLQRVDLATGEVTTLYTHCGDIALKAPNDLVFDRHGGIWFTDHGVRHDRSSDRTGVYYAQPDGSSITEVIFPLDAPNGVGLSPDGNTLYVAETHTGRVFSWALSGPGTLGGGQELLCGLPGLQLFDSLAVDGDGWVCVATLVNGGITAISPDGATVEHLATGDMLTTNICFEAGGGSTAWITASGTGRLFQTEWPRPGLELAYRT